MESGPKMADHAQDASGNAQVGIDSHTPAKTTLEKEPQQQPSTDETPNSKLAHTPGKDTKSGAEKESPQANRSKPRNNHRRGRNRSKASDTSYDSTAERAALSRPNRQPGKSERSQSNGVPISRTSTSHKDGGSEVESTPETISGGRRQRQGNKQKQAKRVSKEENFEVGGVVNGRPLNGTETEKTVNGTDHATQQDKSDSESTVGSNSGRRNRKRRKGKKPQGNNAPLPSITEDHAAAEREERPALNRTSQIGEIGAEQGGKTAIKMKEKVEVVKEEPLRLKLEFNMDIDVEIKAKISGDLTLNMYGKAEFGELKLQLDHAKFG